MGELHVRQVSDADLDLIAQGSPNSKSVTIGSNLLTGGLTALASVILGGGNSIATYCILAVASGATLAGAAVLWLHRGNAKKASKTLERIRVDAGVEEALVDEDEAEVDGDETGANERDERSEK